MPKLKTGLLWYDDNPSRSLEEKVHRAATRYHERYGRHPNVCFVNPADFPANTSNPLDLGDIKVYSLHNVLRHHLWIGVAKQPEKRSPSKCVKN